MNRPTPERIDELLDSHTDGVICGEVIRTKGYLRGECELAFEVRVLRAEAGRAAAVERDAIRRLIASETDGDAPKWDACIARILEIIDRRDVPPA